MSRLVDEYEDQLRDDEAKKINDLKKEIDEFNELQEYEEAVARARAKYPVFFRMRIFDWGNPNDISEYKEYEKIRKVLIDKILEEIGIKYALVNSNTNHNKKKVENDGK